MQPCSKCERLITCHGLAAKTQMQSIETEKERDTERVSKQVAAIRECGTQRNSRGSRRGTGPERDDGEDFFV